MNTAEGEEEKNINRILILNWAETVLQLQFPNTYSKNWLIFLFYLPIQVWSWLGESN
jgi:hypothetical protein